MKKTQLAAAIAIAVSGAVIAPQASAGDHNSMQAQINALSGMMKSMQKELKRVKSAGGSQSLQEWENTVNAVKELKQKKNRVSFRGGFARADHSRYGDILTDANADNSGGGQGLLDALGLSTSAFTGNEKNGKRDGWYFGAALDHHINSDLFGISDLIGVPAEVLAEIMFEYKEFDRTNLRRAPLATAANDSVNGVVVDAGVGPAEIAAPDAGTVAQANSGGPVCSGITGTGGGTTLTTGGAGPYGSCSNSVTVTQFTLSASPKIKFMEGSDFRPWVIPAGFAFHVISPPSDGVSYTTVGVQFAVGADYKIWKDIYAGGDFRYHLTSNATDGVNVDGMTAGGYVSLGF
jgi:hypothetical protein